MKHIIDRLLKISKEIEKRQEIVWMPNTKNSRDRILPFTKNIRPKRIWSLYEYTDKNNKPILPFTPRHNVNAFLEDYMDDWIINKGKLHFYSRVWGGHDQSITGMWLLLEW